jgi:hypothetical protein
MVMSKFLDMLTESLKAAGLTNKQVGTVLDVLESVAEKAGEVEEDDTPVDEVSFKWVKAIRNGVVTKVKKKLTNGRFRKFTPAMKAALRKARAKAQSGIAKLKRAKSFKIRRRKLGEAYVNCGVSCLVSEAFDIVLEDKSVIPVQTGYMFSLYDVAEGTVGIDIFDADGELVKEEVQVDPDFVTSCFSENVLESLQDYGESLDEAFVEAFEADESVEDVLADTKVEDDTDEGKKSGSKTKKVEAKKADGKAPEVPPVAEGVRLGYKNENGYYVVKEGKTFNLGSRVRARAYLVGEGFTVDGKVYEEVKEGKEVTL